MRKTIEIEVKTLNDGWRGGPLASLLRELGQPIDGCEVRATVKSGERDKVVGSAPAYELGDAWILGDTSVDLSLRKTGMHSKLVAMRIVAALVQGQGDHIISIPQGADELADGGPWMRELEPGELEAAPELVKKFAKLSARHNRSSLSGIFCFDRKRTSAVLRAAKEFVRTRSVPYLLNEHFMMEVPLTISDTAFNVAAQASIDAALLNFLSALDATLSTLDPAVDGHLSIAISALTKAGIEQRAIAERLNVSRATVSRWLGGDKLPRFLPTRHTILDELRVMLRDRVAEQRKLVGPREARIGDPRKGAVA